MLLRRTIIVVFLLTVLAGACTDASPPRVSSAPARRSAPTRPATTRNVGWRLDLGDSPGALTTDATGTVAIAGDSHVVAIDHHGRVDWRTPVADLGIQYPALGEGLAIVSSVRSNGHGDPAFGRVVALDRRTGQEHWHVDVHGEPAPATITRRAVFVATTGGELLALTLDGRLRWRVAVTGEVSSRSTLAYDAATDTLGLVALVPHRGYVLALVAAKDGRDVGGLDLGAGDPPSAVTAAGDARIVVGDGDTHELLVIDLRRRVVAHALPTPAAFDPASQPVVANGVAYVVDQGGTVTAMRLSTGRQVWQVNLGLPVMDERPAISGDTLFVAPFAGAVTALSLADGRRVGGGLEHLGGVPVGFALDGRELVVALRLANPDRIVAVPVP